ncbi:MAG: Ig-like domain-containing protein [Gemmatimonadota bacterium]|nr:Ig-like domain-containing protein [Gemmatimonadota bacterium]
MMFERTRTFAVVALAASVLACADNAVGPGDDSPALVDLEPQSGQVGVDVSANPTLRFDRPLAPGMEAYMALHQGPLSGPVVEGSWSMTSDGMTLRFQPAQPLAPATRYTVHVGAGMSGQSGGPVLLTTPGPHPGGAWGTDAPLPGATGMGGSTGTMMGVGWAHPTNGTFGMTFTFTTAE